jgi:hypothetical protein
MVWDPAIPATNADLLSAPVRDNFGALDTALMAALATLANGQVLTKAAGPVLAGVATGTNGHVLTLTAGSPGWAAAPGFANPMSAIGDLIIGSTAGAPARLAIGTAGFVLTSVAGSPAWQSGLSNPMTSIGDLIRGGTSGAPTRMAAVATGAVLASAGVNTAPTWNTAPSLTSLTLSGLTQGSVLFASASGVLAQDNANFFFDDTNNNLRLFGGGVGTSGVGVLALGPSTAPTASPVDTVQLFTQDTNSEAGSRSLAIRTERGGLFELATDAGGASTFHLLNPGGTARSYLYTASTSGGVGTGTAQDFVVWVQDVERARWTASAGFTLSVAGVASRLVSTGPPDSHSPGWRYLLIAN